MKKALFFYLKHIFSISFFAFSVIEAFINGWPMILMGIVIGVPLFFFEYAIRMVLYRPSKKDMEEFNKKHPGIVEAYKKTNPSDIGWM